MFAVSLGVGWPTPFRGKDRGRRVRGVGRGHRPSRGHRPADRRRADLRPVLAVDLLRERADRHRSRHNRAGKGGRVAARAQARPARLARLSRSFTVALSSLVYGLIESNQRSFTDGLVLGCPRRGGGAARRLRYRGAAQRATRCFDLRLLRPADLQRRLGGGVRGFSASIFSVLPLPRAVPAGHSGLLRRWPPACG